MEFDFNALFSVASLISTESYLFSPTALGNVVSRHSMTPSMLSASGEIRPLCEISILNGKWEV